MNLGNPELELIDPTPNIYLLFVQFDKTFFYTKLASRAVVRWSKRMYSCAGICSYEGRGGLCDIALSEPLLKLRPRKDLIETLLHEMIHAFLFVTAKDQDRDGHGPNFQAHMHRINRSAGLNISIYHDFHDEVKLYQTHWWRCNGPCQTKRPHFGIVRRSANRAPGPSDYWWQDHQRKCGGTFLKIKEPEKKTKATNKKPTKTNADITKYINNNNEKIPNNNLHKKPESNKTSKIFHDNAIKNNIMTINSIPAIRTIKSVSPTSPTPSRSQGQTLAGRSRSNSASVAETVRNIWANKQMSTQTDKSPNQKHKSTSHLDSPPTKVKKIDDYFKKTATSLLKDVYGENYKVTQSKDGSKLIAIKDTSGDGSVQVLVDCPVCNTKINKSDINRHLDECLNRDLIEKLSKDNINTAKIEDKGIVNKSVDGKIDKSKTEDSHVTFFEPNYMATKIISNKRLSKHHSVDNGMFKIENDNAPSTSNIKIPSNVQIKSELTEISQHNCACCGKKYNKPIEQHLDECLVFFDNNTTIPEEGNSVIVLDDDEFDETMTLNATGTKTPCPCCLEMIEQNAMNEHLDTCLS